MKSSALLGIVLLLLGAGIPSYGYFSYRTRETVLKVGPLEATADRTRTVSLPPVLGWALVGAGASVLIFSRKGKA